MVRKKGGTARCTSPGYGEDGGNNDDLERHSGPGTLNKYEGKPVAS